MPLPHSTLWRSLGRPQCGFHISAPAYSQRYHTKKAVHIKRNATQSRCSFSYSRPRKNSGRNPVEIACQKTYKPQVNPQSPITPKRYENAQTGDLDSRGIETQPIASRSVWRYVSNSRRDPTAKRCTRNASTGDLPPPNAAIETARPAAQPPRVPTPVPELKPAKRRAAPAHNSLTYNGKSTHRRVSAEPRSTARHAALPQEKRLSEPPRPHIFYAIRSKYFHFLHQSGKFRNTAAKRRV